MNANPKNPHSLDNKVKNGYNKQKSWRCTMTDFAHWLDRCFGEFDYGILKALHNLEQSAGEFFTPFFRLITSLANGGWIFIVLGCLLICFAKTRKSGIAILLSLAVGYLLCNITLKLSVERLRPFLNTTHPYFEEFVLWWSQAGALQVSEFSFPSGHTNCTMAAIGAFVLTSKNKGKNAWLFLFVILMGLTRNYFAVHYPSDILFGILSGGVSALLGTLVSRCIYHMAEKHKAHTFWHGFLEKGLMIKIVKKS